MQPKTNRRCGGRNKKDALGYRDLFPSGAMKQRISISKGGHVALAEKRVHLKGSAVGGKSSSRMSDASVLMYGGSSARLAGGAEMASVKKLTE